mmetsp:Transcript_62277/g.161844  ORF Transcript_62277/g.161844 Transcript_62277/m.161844 type:complete len:297 (-) Transcript_62277:24-914(-)
MQDEESRQRQNRHLCVGPERHRYPTYLELPRPVPETFAAHRVRPPAADTSEHEQEHRRGADEHEQRGEEYEEVVRGECLGVRKHVPLHVDLYLPPPGGVAEALQNAARAHSRELVPRPQVAPRRRLVDAGSDARQARDVPRLLRDQLGDRPRAQLPHDVGRRQPAQRQSSPAAPPLDARWSPGARPEGRGPIAEAAAAVRAPAVRAWRRAPGVTAAGAGVGRAAAWWAMRRYAGGPRQVHGLSRLCCGGRVDVAARLQRRPEEVLHPTRGPPADHLLCGPGARKGLRPPAPLARHL